MDFSYSEGLPPIVIEKNQNPGGRFGATSYINSAADLANLVQF